MKNLLIKLGLWEEKVTEKLPTDLNEFSEAVRKTLHNTVEVDAGWYEVAMKHYCGACEQWFKTASVATHNRFKHKDA